MQRGLQSLNKMSMKLASEALLRCCGSRAWVDQLVGARPFRSLPMLLRTARDVWWSLEEADWLEAFKSHPQIGDHDLGAGRTHGEWARGEQAGALDAEAGLRRRLAEANETYAARFGFIFIICATGKDAGEMLRSLELRVSNERGIEIRVAAEQQAQITELRLNKLLAELEEDGQTEH